MGSVWRGCVGSVLTALLMAILIACGSGGGGGDGNDPGSQPPADNLSGAWEVKQTTKSNCDEMSIPENYTVTATITQSGNQFTMTAPDNPTIKGTISGSTLTGHATFPDSGGTTTYNLKGSISGDGNRFEGTATWVWQGGGDSCNGTTQIVATRLAEASGDASGTWEGSWSSGSHSISGDFTAVITQSGSVLSGTITVPFVGLRDTELKGTASGDSMVFGDIDDTITFTGTRSGAVNAMGTYVYPGMSDRGSWQAVKTEEPVAPAMTWQKSDMGFGFGSLGPLLIGDAQGDGIQRVYAGQGAGGGSSGRIVEFVYSQTGWGSTSFGDIAGYIEEDLKHIYGLALGLGQNDSITRLYAAGYGVAEFTHDGSSFEGAIVADDTQWTRSIILGDARDDGVVRIYAGDHNTIHEIEYQTDKWVQTTIDTGGVSIGAMIITAGRNDGIIRLYAAADFSEHVYEYTYVNDQWQVADCGDSGLGTIQSMVAGDGRGDGQTRFYLAGNGGAQELSFEGGGWIYREIGEISYANAIALGPGRDNGRNFIYIAENQDELSEYGYGNDKWVKSSTLDTELALEGIAVGNGRDDGQMRVYATCRDDHLYEYTASP